MRISDWSSDVCSSDLEGLVFAVHTFFHAAAQIALFVTRQQRIPEPAPDHLDDVPTGTTEHAFEFLNNLAVAAHRAITTRSEERRVGKECVSKCRSRR